jgi:hypothetical protein
MRTATELEADPTVLTRIRGDAWRQLEDELETMTDDARELAEFREHCPQAAKYPALKANDVTIDCAGCGCLLMPTDGHAGRPKRGLPPEVFRKITDRKLGVKRPHCRACSWRLESAAVRA